MKVLVPLFFNQKILGLTNTVLHQTTGNMQLKSQSRPDARHPAYNSFIDFWANLFNIGGLEVAPPQHRKIIKSDTENLERDFIKIGRDMRKSMDQEKKEILSKTQR